MRNSRSGSDKDSLTYDKASKFDGCPEIWMVISEEELSETLISEQSVMMLEGFSCGGERPDGTRVKGYVRFPYKYLFCELI